MIISMGEGQEEHQGKGQQEQEELRASMRRRRYLGGNCAQSLFTRALKRGQARRHHKNAQIANSREVAAEHCSNGPISAQFCSAQFGYEQGH